jgi:PAS domain S-box-containing protein
MIFTFAQGRVRPRVRQGDTGGGAWLLWARFRRDTAIPGVSMTGTGKQPPRRAAPAAWVLYLGPVLGVAAVTALRLPFERVLHGMAPYGLYYVVIAATAWIAGVGPTLLAVALSTFAAWFFLLQPRGSFTLPPGGGASLVLFLLVDAALVWLARAAAGLRRSLEASLAEAERGRAAAGQLAAIVESSEDAILSTDLDGTVRSWNAAAERLYGYRPAEIIGRPVATLIPPSRAAEEREILGRIRRGERVEHFETLRCAKDGRTIEVSLTVSPLHAPDGAVIGASKTARDITERKRAERAVAEQREWFRVTLASIGDAVVTCDRAGRVTFLNAVASELTGWSNDEARGQPLATVFRIVNEETRKPVENPADKVMRTGRIVGLANHTAVVARDGTETAIADSAAPILDDAGQIIGVVLVFRDVGEERRRELDRRAADREREALLDSERAARSEAERANRIKDEFVATLSHELRTPLNAILGWTQILERAGPGDGKTLARGLEVIARNARLQAQLISDLLDISRLASGKVSMNMELVDVTDVVEATLDTMAPTAESKGIAIVRDVARGLGPVAGDPTRLQQIVWNLLSNAIKFTDAGGKVMVSLRRDADAAELVVSDTGTGIKPDFLPFLFDRFRQANASSTRRFGGLGLGLAIVKQLTELHGGKVWAASDGEGKGASFVVRLPLASADEVARTASAPAGDANVGVAGGGLADVTVLLVEDEPDTREMMQRLLAEAGADVVVAADVATALERVRDRRPDLIVSDIGLPGEDGYAFVERLRRMGSHDGGAIPAIAVTAFARHEDRTRALRAGFQAHVTKPIDPSELVTVATSFANMVRARRSSPNPPVPAS